MSRRMWNFCSSLHVLYSQNIPGPKPRFIISNINLMTLLIRRSWYAVTMPTGRNIGSDSAHVSPQTRTTRLINVQKKSLRKQPPDCNHSNGYIMDMWAGLEEEQGDLLPYGCSVLFVCLMSVLSVCLICLSSLYVCHLVCLFVWPVCLSVLQTYLSASLAYLSYCSCLFALLVGLSYHLISLSVCLSDWPVCLLVCPIYLSYLLR